MFMHICTAHSSTLIILMDAKKMDLPALDGNVLITAEACLQTISLTMAFDQNWPAITSKQPGKRTHIVERLTEFIHFS